MNNINETVVKVDHFKMAFGDTTIIKDLSFDIKKGEVFGLLGSNGSGKTTTVRTLLGLYEPTGGKLTINDKKFSPETDIKIGYLPEERGLYKKEKVGNVMRYFAELKGLNKTESDEYISKFLQRVDLADKINIRLDRLSSGQQQKVQMGITMMGHPDLLILDEPTKGFDPVNRKLLMDIVEEERLRGATVMMITHNMDEVERLCDRVLLLKDGEAKAYGSVEDIRDQAGQNIVKITFSGILPSMSDAYRIKSQDKTHAELEPKEGKTAQDVLESLVNRKVNLRQYSIERPTLDEIFVKVYGTKVNAEGEN